MADNDRNRRAAGWRRVNAVFERLRAKADRTPAAVTAADAVAPPDQAAPGCRLVLLVALPAPPDADALSLAAAAAFPDEEDVEVGENGYLQVGGWAFRATAGAGPLLPPDAADRLPELRLQAAAREHAGWLAVEVTDAPDGTSAATRASLAGRLLAALAPADALALFRPSTGRVSLYTPAAAGQLRAGRAAAAFRPADQPVPIAGVADDDPRLTAAAAVARNRFGEFLAALAERGPADTFAVKVPFADDHGREFMWVAVDSVDATHIVGRLDNRPAFVRAVHLGERVLVARADLNDWLYVRGGELHGGFTLKLLDEHLKPPRSDVS
jgi:uncharacterized protein YegJ (DUF2314 family)